MLRVIIISALLALAGCNTDIDVTPNINGIVVDGQTITIFYADIDGDAWALNNAVYECADGYVYDRANPGVPINGDDGIDDTCTVTLYSRTVFDQSDVPLYQEPAN